MRLSIPAFDERGPVDEDTFTDLTEIPVVATHTIGDTVVVEFAEDLDDDTRREVVRRVQTGEQLQDYLACCRDFLETPDPDITAIAEQVLVLTRMMLARFR